MRKDGKGEGGSFVDWWNTQAVVVSVHQDTVVAFNELTGSEGFPEGDKHVLVGVSVVVTNELLDGLGRLSCVVEWNSRDVMV